MFELEICTIIFVHNSIEIGRLLVNKFNDCFVFSPFRETMDFRSCLTWIAGGSCTTAYAQLLNDFYDVM